MATFRKVEFNMVRGNGYGQYYIVSKYKGVELKVHTTDSEAFDYINDDYNEEKHKEALKHCYMKIRQAYENR